MESRVLETLFKDQEVLQLLQVNRSDNILWFNKESFEVLVASLFLVAVVQITSEPDAIKYLIAKEISEVHGISQKWLKAAEKSGYKLEKLLELIR